MSRKEPMEHKGRKIVGWVVTGLLTALFVMSAMGKITARPDSEMGQNFIKYGLDGKLLLIAVGELASASMFIIPRTAPLCVLLLSSHMGGAIATHMEHGESYVFQSIILLLVWLAAGIRLPEIFTRLNGK